MKNSEIIFVTPGCPHYRLKLFEKLSKIHNIKFLFYEKESDKYIGKNLLENSNLKGEYLYGFYINKIRIVPLLIQKLFKETFNIIICDNSRISYSLSLSFFIAKLLRKKFILWSEIWMNPPTLFHKIIFPLRKYIYKHSDAIIACGIHVKKYLTEIGIAEKKIFISYNTLNNELFNKKVCIKEKSQLLTNLNINGKKIILYVGRLAEEKGLPYLLQAYQMLEEKHNITLLIIGNGNDKSILEKQVSTLSLNNVKFLDYIPYNQLYIYYSIADLLVLPSITTKFIKEVWGFVINEAMNQGCPVIATDAVGAAMGGLVENGKTGLVVEERNSKELANAIDKILNDKNLQNKMKENALLKIQTWDENLQVKGFLEAIEYVRVY